MPIAQKLAKTLTPNPAVCLLLITISAYALAQPSPQAISEALTTALKDNPATALVLDANSGKSLAYSRLNTARTLRSTPGSVLKPFFLAYALNHGIVHPQTTFLCRRTSTIAGRDLSCTHSQSESVFNAEGALAYSCNSYFIQLASRFSPQEVVTALADYGLVAPSMTPPASQDQTALFLLGLEKFAITPQQLATAYRKLALQLHQPQNEQALSSISRGLENSVNYGMANNAQVQRMNIAGKTGTASDRGQPWTHGWFAGFTPAEAPKIILIIYLPKGNGADAAHLAQRFFQNYKELSTR